MVLTKLGSVIEQSITVNSEGVYTFNDVKGMTIDKEVIPTKANVKNTDLSKFLIVNPNEFIYNPRTHGKKIGLGFNQTDKPFIISWNNIAFKVKELDRVNPIYLYMYFNRNEWDRKAVFDSWGSSTEVFSWKALCDMEIDLPPLHIQEKYVAIYKAMLANQKAYENGLEDLKLVCDAELDIFKRTCQLEYVGNLFSEVDKRNTGNQLSNVLGININKEFMASKSTSEKLERYKIIEKDQLAYSSMQTGRDEVIRIALYSEDEPALVSPAYSILVTKENVLPEYIMMWFSRKEVDRLGWFLSDSSIRANLDLKRFYEIKIPIPDIHIQQSIVDIYNVYITRKQINERLKKQIKDICPILIAGAIKEANANA
ncbi:restriction endonuclease subunit S [Streptococcus uberis]|uniref:restriction endonuclease subunit S n=1 Tax=Streptococcus uberis TaxID=1349 RepID=UPI0038918624